MDLGSNRPRSRNRDDTDDIENVLLDLHFTISIYQLACIRNPFAAGNRVITISTFVLHYEPDEITAVTRKTTTVNPLEGPRGSEFTLLGGKGYAQGTVTVFAGDDDTIDPRDTLASVKTSRGCFTTKLEARRAGRVNVQGLDQRQLRRH